MEFIDEETFCRLLEQALNLSPADKNILYHNIHGIIKSLPPQDAAQKIINELEMFFKDRQYGLIEKAEDKHQGKISPVFRRIG